MARAPYPLQWPDGWARTAADKREASRFYTQGTGGKTGVSLLSACRDVHRQLTLLNAVQVVITSNLPTKGNGMPYATHRTDDPGVAVWWLQRGGVQGKDNIERVIACDRWMTPAENLRAIAKTIDAIRGTARWGTSTIEDRAFSGFAALPPAGGTASGVPGGPVTWPPPEPSRTWTDFFHVTATAPRASVKAIFRTFAQELHPDHNNGDTSAKMAELNKAWAQAEAWFDWKDLMLLETR